jgi:SAM-dependent methyltransferase
MTTEKTLYAAGTLPGVSPLARFIDANKRFCRGRLQPRLYPVGHMTALEYWFRRRVKGHHDAALLEFGCGRRFQLTRLLGDRFSYRFATDLHSVPQEDLPDGVVFRQCSTERVPFEAAQFDAIVIRSVMEHVENPDHVFRELARVTKPGGSVFMNLPNKWDYVSVIARMAGPFKSFILRTLVRTGWDDFPVAYRCNTRRALTRVAKAAGFEVVEFVPLPSQPYYLAFFVPLYILGAIYQFVISLVGLDVLQPSFVVHLRKLGGASDASVTLR